MYDALDGVTKVKVNDAAAEIYGHGGYATVTEWWESLNCRLKRIATGDGNTDDPSSEYCTPVLAEAAQTHVTMVGTALLGL